MIPETIGHHSIGEALRSITDCTARNPWANRQPVVLHNVFLHVDEAQQWAVIDTNGDALPLAFQTLGWKALVLTGLHPCSLATELEDGVLWAMSIGTDAAWMPL